MAEWIIVGLTSISVLGVLVAALVRVVVAVNGNTQATKALSDWLERQEGLLATHGEAIGDHEARLTSIETIHRIRGCNEVME